MNTLGNGNDRTGFNMGRALSDGMGNERETSVSDTLSDRGYSDLFCWGVERKELLGTLGFLVRG